MLVNVHSVTKEASDAAEEKFVSPSNNVSDMSKTLKRCDRGRLHEWNAGVHVKSTVGISQSCNYSYMGSVASGF